MSNFKDDLREVLDKQLRKGKKNSERKRATRGTLGIVSNGS